MTENTGFQSYRLYNSLHLHFTSKSYDFVKYHGKSNVSVDAFDRRKDKYQFHKLARKYSLEEIKNFFIANLLDKPDRWPGELLQPECDDTYRKWCKVNQSLSYVFQNDVEKLFSDVVDPNDLLVVESGEYPILLVETMHGSIALETLVILNDLMGFFPMWKEKIKDEYVWPILCRKVERYTPLLVYDRKKMVNILREQI